MSTLGASHAILMAVYHQRFIPVVSVPLVMEYEEVCKRPGLLPHLKTSQIDAILDLFCSRSYEQRIFSIGGHSFEMLTTTCLWNSPSPPKLLSSSQVI